MSLRDFSWLFAICFVWGSNIVLTRWVVADEGVPPLFFAGLRFALLALMLIPFLWPMPRQWGRLFLISMCIGACHFGLLFSGLALSEASAAAVVGQLGVPFATIFSVILLGEVVRWRRTIGIVLSFAGVVIIAFDPDTFEVSTGLVLVALSALIGAFGGVQLKKIDAISPFQMQGWVGAFSFAPLFALSAVLETGQAAPFTNPWLWLATAYAVLGVSLFGHGSFYQLVKRYEVSLLSPLTLMTPIWGVVLGIVLLGEPASEQLLLGGAVCLSGVLIIALRPNRKLPGAALGRRHRVPLPEPEAQDAEQAPPAPAPVPAESKP